MKAKHFIIAILAAFTLACSHAKDPGPTPPSKDEMAVLVYMVASNDLGTDDNGDAAHGADEDDLVEMTLGAAKMPQGSRWLVYHTDADATDAVLKELNRDGSWKTLRSWPAGSSVTASRMRQVLDAFESAAPASNRGLVLWSHATGWLEDGIDESADGARAPVLKSFGSDFGKRMNTTTLAGVLDGRGYQYVYFDACYMGTVEVAYELRHALRYLVASPSELPRAGMPYTENMPELLRGGREALIAAATNTFNHYDRMPDADDRTCTMTVVDLAGMDALAAATRDIYAKTPLPHPLERVTNYRGTARQGLSLDFGEYVRALATASNIDLTAFDAAMTDAVIYCAATPSLWDAWPMRNPTGLATYVFTRESDFSNKGYDRLAWAQDVVTHHLN